MEPFHSSWLPNQTHPQSLGSLVPRPDRQAAAPPCLEADAVRARGPGGLSWTACEAASTRAGAQDIRMDEVTQAVENLKKEWSQAVSQLEESIAAIKSCGKSGKGTEEANSLPRLNGSAQDALQLLKSLQFRLDLLAQQLPTFEEVQSGQATLESWDEQYKKLRASLRNANLQAKENIRKAAQEERELLLGGGEESTIRRRNLQTKAGMTSAAESITESLRRSRQMMVQEVERSASTLATFDESTSVLRKAEGEYQGHRSLLMRTRGLLSTMQRQDVLDSPAC
ncbi:uncharacterized protein LOC112872628 isoform X3 [Panicum hallii]|uniref:uncharacterized protein LOC112872628 isoform X3 n=1 Tax=Panicum hallii TaxID=206008 RepID=UPI000DF4E4E4|nr:uncharacterized protein LOC112872628 isoform X3 [Panicum hallii]